MKSNPIKRFILKPLNTIAYGINNLIFYFKLIYGDRQWDEHYMWKFLYTKLARMEDFYSNEENYNTEDNGRLASISETKSIVGRLMEDMYECIEVEKNYEIYGNIAPTYALTLPNGLRVMKMTQENVKTDEDRIKCAEDMDFRLEVAKRNRYADIDRLCELLKYDSRK